MSNAKIPAGMTASVKKHFLKILGDVPDRWQPHHYDALRRYCELSEVRDLVFKALSSGQYPMVIVRSDGQQQMTPLLNSLQQIEKLLYDLGDRLGLLPVSETKNKLPTKPEEKVVDPLAEAVGSGV